MATGNHRVPVKVGHYPLRVSHGDRFDLTTTFSAWGVFVCRGTTSRRVPCGAVKNHQLRQFLVDPGSASSVLSGYRALLQILDNFSCCASDAPFHQYFHAIGVHNCVSWYRPTIRNKPR